MKSKPFFAVILVLAARLLTACGGGGGGGGGGENNSPTLSLLATPTLAVSYGIKQLKFTWDSVNGAAYYQLFEDPDGVSDYTQVGGNLSATAHSHNIALHRRINARYLLKACNPTGCISSPEVFISAGLTAAMGYVKASNTETADYFGYSVALSGDGQTLAVGAFLEASNATGIGGSQGDDSASWAGAVYVYTRSGGTWIQQAYIKATNTQAGDYFGYSVALSGDGNILAVGAVYEASNATGIGGNQGDESAPGAGAVYVYTRGDGTWTPQTYIKATNTQAYDTFGSSLALSGDGNTLAVGAAGEDSNATGINGDQTDNSAGAAGAVYLYTRSGRIWRPQAYVKASNTEMADGFGDSIALSDNGNTLAVGAAGEDSNATGIGASQADNNASEAGAVYVYLRNGNVWGPQAYIKASNTQQGDGFGGSLAVSGDGNTLAVGARGEDSNATGIGGSQTDNSASFAGAVYVYTRSASAWTPQTYVKASNTGAYDGFGGSVALSGDGTTLAVGARGEDSNATGIDGSQTDNSALDAGAVYIYTRSARTWTPQAYVKATKAASYNEFGIAVALSGDGNTLAVGDWLEDSNATGVGGNQSDNKALAAGAVYLY